MQATTAARYWAASVVRMRDMMVISSHNGNHSLPGGPMMPSVPQLPGPTTVAVQLEAGFFGFFTGIVAQIKNHQAYDVADGQLLGIEGAQVTPPDPATTIPLLAGEVFTSGQPELSCRKGVFQGYKVWLTRPGQPKKEIGFSTSRRFNVEEPLPASGTAEIWSFETQYRYQNLPFGQVSQPINLTVRG